MVRLFNVTNRPYYPRLASPALFFRRLHAWRKYVLCMRHRHEMQIDEQKRAFYKKALYCAPKFLTVEFEIRHSLETDKLLLHSLLCRAKLSGL